MNLMSREEAAEEAARHRLAREKRRQEWVDLANKHAAEALRYTEQGARVVFVNEKDAK